jgi:integrase
MASTWIKRRETKDGKLRYRVVYRLGGRESAVRYAGSFKTMREALVRKAFVAGELAAQRVPDLASLVEPAPTPTLEQAAQRWQASRVDVSENTRLQHRSSVRLIPGELRARPFDAITPQDIADAIATLHAAGKKRETIRKAVAALAMVLDHAGVKPNPARDKIVVKLPRADHVEATPPSAEHVAAVFHLLPRRHRLALLWLDWSGARVGSIDETLVSDYDEPRRRLRLRAAVSKSRRALWVDLHPALADAIEQAIGPREDRIPDARIFAGSGADALRTAIGKACRAAAVPVFSPHDLRHRRISLLHLRGMPWARIGELVGQRDLAVTANTYTHVLVDEIELDYAELLR